jgi:hypothetical protein
MTASSKAPHIGIGSVRVSDGIDVAGDDDAKAGSIVAVTMGVNFIVVVVVVTGVVVATGEVVVVNVDRKMERAV